MAPSTVRRVLAGHDVDLPSPPSRPAPRDPKPWPDWVEYRPRQVWGWDVTHFGRCKPAPNCFAIIDLVSRRWISTLLSPEENAVQTQVVFLDALEAEGLLAGDDIPILLPVSDNGPPMTAADTRSFMALCSIAQHFGRPGVPTDQAPIESFFGHIRPSGHTSRPSTTPRSWPPSSSAFAATTTRCGCMPPSAISPPTTNTKDEETPSAKPS